MRYLIIAGLLVGAILGTYYLTTDAKSKAPVDPFMEAFPVLGFKDITPEGDTIEHKIPDFTFINQDSMEVTNETFAGKAYVSDFFFIHCPSICPRVKQQMLRIYEKFKDNDDLLMLSHSIDTRNDTVPALKTYAKKLDIDTDKWQFVTGDKDMIFTLADEYFVTAMVAPDVAGGFDHSGRIILVDENRQVRAFAEGTDPEDVTRFLKDLEWFMEETYGEQN